MNLSKKLFSILLLVGCGSDETIPFNTQTGDDFLEVQEQFIDDYEDVKQQEFKGKVIINIDYLGILDSYDQEHGTDVLAGCVRETGEVLVKQDFWYAAYNIRFKTAVIYHELGHCVLGITDHRIGDSIMARSLHKYFVIQDYHLRDLFLN